MSSDVVRAYFEMCGWWWLGGYTVGTAVRLIESRYGGR